MFVAVRYHVWWPGPNDPYYLYNISENTARTTFYGVNDVGVPAFKIDGFIEGGGYPSYWTHIQNRHYMETCLDIQLSGDYDEDTGQGTLDITITAIEDAYWDSLYLRIALTESDIYWHAPNGAYWHHQTMRDMIPNAQGQPIEISYGETIELSQNFSCPSPLVPENSELVVWVQSDYLREVYQAARVGVTELGQVSVDDKAIIPSEFKLLQNYPNPFNASTIIEFNLGQESPVILEIYDLTGRKVNTLCDGIYESGAHRLVWDGTDFNGNSVASGLYFYRLSDGSRDTAKQMTLLK